jgi:hypothetical protein
MLVGLGAGNTRSLLRSGCWAARSIQDSLNDLICVHLLSFTNVKLPIFDVIPVFTGGLTKKCRSEESEVSVTHTQVEARAFEDYADRAWREIGFL